MKLTALLSQYLYNKQRLDLPGIGTFTADSPSGNNVSFDFNPSVKEDPALIDFISQHSGKMKALASSDLESYLQQAIQFINIGKPFMIDGVGTLSKLKSGIYEFTPGILTTERIKEYNTAPQAAHSREELHQQDAYEPFLEPADNGPKWKKPLIGFLILAGIGLAIWIGYLISGKKDKAPEETVTENTQEPATVVIPDNTVKDSGTAAIPNRPDSLPATAATSVAGTYKYVLETAGSKRAFKRYNQLKELGWKVELETTDSVSYKILMKLSGVSADTTRVKDSLGIISGRKVMIEH